MISNFNYYRQIENPNMYLCNPDGRIISAINAEDRHLVLRFNDLSELTFTVHKNICKDEDYNRFQTKRLIFLEGIGWFQIRNVSETTNGDESSKAVTAESHQTIFKDRGFISENRVYVFYNPKDPLDEHYDDTDVGAIPSVIGQLYQQLGVRIQLTNSEPDVTTDYGEWTLVWIDNDLFYTEGDEDNICRTFEEKTTFGYDFMINDVEKAFDVVFDFDIMHHAIKVKFTNSLTTKTNIYLSFDNLINSVELKEDAEDIVTVLSCSGSNLDIRTVNPMGTNYICNFDHYKKTISDDGIIAYPWMSQALISTLDSWKAVWTAWQEDDNTRTGHTKGYSSLVLDLQQLYVDQAKIAERIQSANLILNDLSAAQDQYVSTTGDIYIKCTSSTQGAKEVVANTSTPTSSQIKLSDVQATGATGISIGDYVILVSKQSQLQAFPTVVETVDVGDKSKLAGGIGLSAYADIAFSETSNITAYAAPPTISDIASPEVCWQRSITAPYLEHTYYLYLYTDGTYVFKDDEDNASSGTWSYDLSKTEHLRQKCIYMEQTSGATSELKGVYATQYWGNKIQFKDIYNDVSTIEFQLDSNDMYTLKKLYTRIANGETADYTFAFSGNGTTGTAKSMIAGYNETEGSSTALIYFTDDSTSRSYCKLKVASAVDVAVNDGGIAFAMGVGESGFVTLNNISFKISKISASSFKIEVDDTTVENSVSNGAYFNYSGNRYRLLAASDGFVSVYYYYVSGFERYTTYLMLTGQAGWCKIWEAYVSKLDTQADDKQAEIDAVVDELEYINNICDIQKYVKNVSDALYRELQYYWIEGEYENNNLAVLDGTTIAETIDLAKELMEAGMVELEKVSQPTFEMTVDAIDFTKIFEYKSFADELELGKIITIEKTDGVRYLPALLAIELDLDTAGSFSLAFSNAFKTDETAMTIADLLNESTSTSRTVAANWSNLTKYTRDKKTIYDLLRNPLDKTLRAMQANMTNQQFTIDSSGILGRKYTADYAEVIEQGDTSYASFEPEQMRIINNVIMFTDDNWETAKLALGKVVYNDEGEEKTAYGLLAEVLVGELIMGNTLKIKNENSSVLIDDSGILIQKTETIDGFPVLVPVFQATKNGNVSLAGNVTLGGSITLGGNITWSAGSSPVQIVYARTSITKPANATQWSTFPADSSDSWHKTFDSTNDKFASYTYDGGATWTDPVKSIASDGKGINSLTEYFYASDAEDATLPTQGDSDWKTSVSATNYGDSYPYLWSYTSITYTQGSPTTTTPQLIGHWGSDGTDGTNGTDGSPGADGADGTDGDTIETISLYILNNGSTPTKPATSVGSSGKSSLPDTSTVTSWSTVRHTPTSSYLYLWQSQRVFINGSPESGSEWTTPILINQVDDFTLYLANNEIHKKIIEPHLLVSSTTITNFYRYYCAVSTNNAASLPGYGSSQYKESVNSTGYNASSPYIWEYHIVETTSGNYAYQPWLLCHWGDDIGAGRITVQTYYKATASTVTSVSIYESGWASTFSACGFSSSNPKVWVYNVIEYTPYKPSATETTNTSPWLTTIPYPSRNAPYVYEARGKSTGGVCGGWDNNKVELHKQYGALAQDEIFASLFENGTVQGIRPYLNPDTNQEDIYINATYIKAGHFKASNGTNDVFDLYVGDGTANNPGYIKINTPCFSVTEQGVITATSGTIGGFTINASYLSNTDGNAYIKITNTVSGQSYETYFRANKASASYSSTNATTNRTEVVGWSLDLDGFNISAKNSSIISGISIKPTYLKKSGSSNTLVSEGCITTDTEETYISGSTVQSAVPFIIGIPRANKQGLIYNPLYEWSTYARFVDFKTAELIYNSSYSGSKWQLKDINDNSTYDLTSLIPYLATHKYYVWVYTSALNEDNWASCTQSTHGFSNVVGAIAIPRSPRNSLVPNSSSLSGYNYTAQLVVAVDGTTVYVGNDDNSANSGFYCVIFGS